MKQRMILLPRMAGNLFMKTILFGYGQLLLLPYDKCMDVHACFVEALTNQFIGMDSYYVTTTWHRVDGCFI